MKNIFFTDGRLAWPAVVAFVFLCSSVVLFDLCWRIVTVSFEALTMIAALFVFLGLGLILVVARLSRIRREPPGPLRGGG